MKYIGIGLIWLGYAGAVAAVTLGTSDPSTLKTVASMGAIAATISTFFVAVTG